MEWSTSLRPRLIEPGVLAEQGVSDRTLDTVAHEFFHVWKCEALTTLRAWSLGLYATYEHTGLVDRRRVHKLLRPLDAPSGRALDDARFLRQGSLHDSSH